MLNLYAEALSTFSLLFEEAKSSSEIEPDAMMLATASLEGHPSVRTVLLKKFDARGFVFYSHLDSPKGRDLQDNPQAALLFLWRSLREAGVQVRIEGRVKQVLAEEADAYFASRPRQSQIGAWASMQSCPLGSPEEFQARLAEVKAMFEGRDVPRPEEWVGFRVVPRVFEFWYGASFRLHERWRYQADAAGYWRKFLLYP
ncbi:pyridoxamine 5'-phosphate oxidase [Xylella fastidiosa subsp. morus]|uniref:Pyridoxine/pyridoxamine 5'-phosphate oxidase n=1 Tax=Xylella fastidiosa subsp. multiplex TaxID=644357 RepID=A0AAW6HVR3_XYLFS|nr:pyridoxamine 5'-phosphate oxidase [Xylella fastidiosa]AIC12119.1 pyridoxamine 5'-phosphate oxidase [Xylella fastidiosa MUL0034]EWG14556.1 pyridoxamine 5'-phosphate oxidase [Xylella fastidiosa Mul-MD]KAJ4853022.1 pyridoxamine 5'-phosphate oxidase [Xylella fastidiosa subsp. multiplex]KFA41203.1 pyridoxamine 5'-phosphate oxidase [Xylella fastidiosa]MBS9444980.1 pyridoxamine 5'-phosphate oxidase [Xylella fastidiosa subsp. multiplex]